MFRRKQFPIRDLRNDDATKEWWPFSSENGHHSLIVSSKRDQQTLYMKLKALFTGLSIRLGPTAATMYVNLATCLLSQGRHVDVEEWARQATLLDPRLGDPHRLVGCSLEARGRIEQAEATFREAVRLDPKLVEAQYRLGSILHRLNRPKDRQKNNFRANHPGIFRFGSIR